MSEPFQSVWKALGRGDVGKGQRIQERLPCHRLLQAHFVAQHQPKSNMLFATDLTRWTEPMRVLPIGGRMEESVALINAAKEALTEAREELKKLANDANSLGQVILPKMGEHINQLRAARMTVTAEVHESLAAMREVRKFFLERDYDVEMERLTRFVKLCRDLKEMKDDGTLDAVSLVAVKMALQEEK